ncbi:MAG: exodeoxyribonuclease VII small subunit [Coriobacteriales bacterium]|jgi:exodeoxyribonuclease VII small subunit|nr:exodeoxyribonuclease VII small subunit [Coriobacteriales bacterium]
MANQSNYGRVRERLEDIVAQVRAKDVPLEKSLDLYEEALRLGSQCAELIDSTDFGLEELQPQQEAAGDTSADIRAEVEVEAEAEAETEVGAQADAGAEPDAEPDADAENRVARAPESTAEPTAEGELPDEPSDELEVVLAESLEVTSIPGIDDDDFVELGDDINEYDG